MWARKGNVANGHGGYSSSPSLSDELADEQSEREERAADHERLHNLLANVSGIEICGWPGVSPDLLVERGEDTRGDPVNGNFGRPGCLPTVDRPGVNSDDGGELRDGHS